MKFSFEVTETLQRTVTVDARNEDDAERRVLNLYHSGEIELDAEDLTGWEITHIA